MKRIQTLLYAAGIVAALGFGSASAFATPTTARYWTICPMFPMEESCAMCCEDRLAKFHNYNPDNGECRCWH
jgi:hypothetical protein